MEARRVEDGMVGDGDLGTGQGVSPLLGPRAASALDRDGEDRRLERERETRDARLERVELPRVARGPAALGEDSEGATFLQDGAGPAERRGLGLLEVDREGLVGAHGAT